MQADLEPLAAVIQTLRTEGSPVSLLIVVPITSYLSGSKIRKIDINDTSQMRTVLEPAIKFAEKHRIAIVCVTHYSKDATRSSIHRVIGSSAFVAVSRSVITVGAAPDGGVHDKVLAQVKNNLPNAPEGAVRFHTERLTVAIDDRNGADVEATRVVWDGVDPNALNVQGGTRGPISRYATIFPGWVSAHFILEKPANGWLPVSDVMQAAVSAGVASRKWWDDHSSDYLEKANVGGTWMCRLQRVPPPLGKT